MKIVIAKYHFSKTIKLTFFLISFLTCLSSNGRSIAQAKYFVFPFPLHAEFWWPLGCQFFFSYIDYLLQLRT